MARWQPDARGRMVQAALELFVERGMEQTTVADIAARAGVTERTFFRHFSDKREVLFGGSRVLQETVVQGIAAAPRAAGPLDAVVTGLVDAAPLLDHAHARRRATAIAANPGLQERELAKLAALSSAAAAALRARGVGDRAAGLAADSGVAVFKDGFDRWISGSGDPDLVSCIRAARDDLRAAVASS